MFYITFLSLSSMSISLIKKLQIAIFFAKDVNIQEKYIDLSNVFSK